MTRSRSWAALLGVATLVLGGCGKSSGGTASSRPSGSGAPPTTSAAAAAPSDTAAPGATASALPSASAAPTVTPAATPAPPRREPTAAELLQDDPRYVARGRRLDALYQNARERDPTGQVDHEQAAALAQLHACVDRACLDAWFNRREAALRQYIEN